MAIKSRLETPAKTDKKTTQKVPATEVKSLVCFRTKQLTKKKAEKVFDDLGISMSGALNMFLTQVARDKGLPFTPTAQKKEKPNRTKNNSDAGYNSVLDDLWEEI